MSLAQHIPAAILASPGTTNARLAAAVAAFIQAEDAMEAGRLSDGYYPQPLWAARRKAFNTLKTTFETEFPK